MSAANIFPNIYLYVQQNEEMYRGLEQLRQGGLIHDIIIIFGWSIPLMPCSHLELGFREVRGVCIQHLLQTCVLIDIIATHFPY